MVEKIKIIDKNQWLSLRLDDITSTDISALFYRSPYKTYYGLYEEKKSRYIDEIDPTEAMEIGSMIEDAIAKMAIDRISKSWGYVVNGEKYNYYIRDPQHRMGSSFDWMIKDNDGVNYILEIKNVSVFAFKDRWHSDSQGEIVAPAHIELQLQHQMELTGINDGFLCVLVGGNSLKILKRKRNKKLGQTIKEKIKEFWGYIDADTMPPIDYRLDSHAIIESSKNISSDEAITATPELIELIQKYRDNKKSLDYFEIETKALKAEILHKTKNYIKVIGNGWELDTRLIGQSNGKYITQDMVGQVVGKKSGYRQFKISE